MNGRDDSEGVVASSFFRSVRRRLCPACLCCNLADWYLLFLFTAPPTRSGLVFISKRLSGLSVQGLAVFEVAKEELSYSTICMVWAKDDPRLDPLRSEPRFQAILQRMSFPQ
jgi:hypothetical protein